ncbi:MAG: hypothetical protein HDT08_03300 [Bacteroidales bacterium]|nr:hypothetical protein [Bacteroidales bacterium]
MKRNNRRGDVRRRAPLSEKSEDSENSEESEPQAPNAGGVELHPSQCGH